MTVRIGVFSDDLASDFLAACDLAAGAGVDGVAVRNVGGKNVLEADLREFGTIATQARDHGLAIASVGSQYGRRFYLGDDVAQHHAEQTLEKAIVAADRFGTDLIRVFALWLRGKEPLEEWSRRPARDEYLDGVVARLQPSVKRAERAGVRLMVELEGASYAGTVAEAAILFEAVDSPALALCWDVCNGWWSGEDPVAVGLPRALRLPIVDVQTKDVLAREDDPTTPTFGRAVTGTGDVGYPEILPALIRHGYSGWITAERVHHPARPEVELNLQRATLDDIDHIHQIVGQACEEIARA